jgi:hypothetical protein
MHSTADRGCGVQAVVPDRRGCGTGYLVLPVDTLGKDTVGGA